MADRTHPNAPPDKDNPIDHEECAGQGCPVDGGSGMVPGWLYTIDS
ncbi:hypothetical protein [Herbidospora daliensis]|nr:hypothetical protein [Herbidospora daliensis]